MFNKKVLAAAVALTFTSSAFAAIDLDATTAAAVGTVSVATETFAATDLDGNGRLAVTNAANILDVTAKVGFTVAQSTSKYVRVDLTNAVFGAAPTLATDSGSATYSATVSQGGTTSDSFVIFEITDSGADIAQDDVLTLAAASINVDNGATVTAQYRLYETAAGAVNQATGDLLVNKTQTALTFGTANNRNITIVDTAIGTVDKDFLEFTVNSGAPATADYSVAATARLGELDVDLALTAGFIKPDGTAVVIADIIDTSQVLQYSGDFSYGTWTVQNSNTCAGGGAIVDTPTISADKSLATTAALDPTAADLYLCLTVNTTDEVIQKTPSITVTLVDNAITDDSGVIKYDTATVVVPYLSTFADYNQRVYLVNNSSRAADYTTNFVTEAGTTAVGGTKATGTVPAGEMLMIKAGDLADISGATTRTYAEIEVEVDNADLEATTQIINLDTKGTDTVVLEVKAP